MMTEFWRRWEKLSWNHFLQVRQTWKDFIRAGLRAWSCFSTCMLWHIGSHRLLNMVSEMTALACCCLQGVPGHNKISPEEGQEDGHEAGACLL